jgi:hypothetical protein
MSRYHTLVVVPGDADAPEDACEAAAELLYPYMYNHDEPTRGHNFDYMYSPEDIADLPDEDITDHMWSVSEILEPETLAELQVEAIVTLDGLWHEPDDPGRLCDDRAWLDKARQMLQQHRECLALRHVLHT